MKKRAFRLVFGLLLSALLSLSFGLYVHAEKSIDRAFLRREASLRLAEELRRSSDDLTRLARTAVINGDALAARHFEEVLAIRDGRSPRPIQYENVYWDLVDEQDRRPRDFGDPEPLNQRLAQAGITDEEFALLAQAKELSDLLAQRERAVMGRSLAADLPAQDRAALSRELFDRPYHDTKRRILSEVAEFRLRVDARTETEVSRLMSQALLWRWLVVAAFAGLVAFVSWLALSFRGQYLRMRNTLARIEASLGLCPNCKKVRDQEGRWSELEAYLERRQSASLDRGLCPDCRARWFPDPGT